MSKLVGNELTSELFSLLKGNDVGSKTGKAILLVTTDEKGWPHPAMLSYHEVVAKSLSRVDLAIGRTSTTAKNLRRDGKITVLVTDDGLNYYIKGKTQDLRPSIEGISFMSLFRVEVEELLEDQEPGAVITSGVTFHRPKKQETEELVEKIFNAVKAEP